MNRTRPRTSIFTLTLTVTFAFAFAGLACDSSGEKAGGDKASEAPAEIKEGSSCEGVEGAVYACDGQAILFCSSLTDSKYKKQDECKPEQTCTVADDKASARCS